MKKLLKTLADFLRFLFPSRQWTPLTRIFAGCLFFKFFYFNLIWCLQTTFTSFSMPETYLSTALVMLVLLIPFACFRAAKLQLLLMFLLDGLLVANLMYARTYYVVIPISSYLVAGNLADFGPSVLDSLRWFDAVFFLSSILCVVAYRRRKRNDRGEASLGLGIKYAIVLLLCFLANYRLIERREGTFKATYAYWQGANYYTCLTPMYTLFGTLLYDGLQENAVCTHEDTRRIAEWLDARPAYHALPDTLPGRENLIIVLAESLESWVLEQTVEGNEVTPHLNRLLKEPSTLYAPHTLTQVKGGRSIDGQLLLNAGMMPINSGAYSIKHPDNTFYTLPKAMKQKYNARSYIATVDKKIVWNQHTVAKNFGVDSLLTRPDFVMEEKIGSRPKLGDVPFLRQCTEKMAREEIWKKGENIYMLCVTYSGHNPFRLPEELKQIRFSDEYPERMRDYMTMANYTDRAIGQFVDYLRSRPDYDRTLVVITGDHEGLADDRSRLCNSPKGKGIVSDKQFTPFIVLNSPVGMRYEGVIGQVDMYSTLLQLMRLDDYEWKGMGQSILDPSRPHFAIGSQGDVEGDTTNVSPAAIEQARRAFDISDKMIKFDYFGRVKPTR